MIDRLETHESCESPAEPERLIEALQAMPLYAALIVASNLPRTASQIAIVRSQVPTLPIVLVLDEEDPLALISEGVKAGVNAILDTGSTPRELRAALSTIDASGLFLSGYAVERLQCRRTPFVHAAPGPDVLSPRQREVLSMVADGMSTAEIADTLGVSPRTVDSHRLAISRRLGLHNVADLIRYAMTERLLPT